MKTVDNISDVDPLLITEPIVITRDEKTGLPRIECKHAAPEEEMTPDRIADLLLEQEVTWATLNKPNP